MALIDDINNLPTTVGGGNTGHLNNHQVIHAALKDHESRLGARDIVGTGSPEGRITATVGTTYTDSAATNGAIRWIKSSGTGTTGWRVTEGDTGWRIIDSHMGDGWTGRVSIRRDRNQVWARANGATRGDAGTITMATIPSGMLPGAGQIGIWRGSLFELDTLSTPFHRVYQGGGEIRVGTGTESKALYGELTWITSEAWPTSLPGTPA